MSVASPPPPLQKLPPPMLTVNTTGIFYPICILLLKCIQLFSTALKGIVAGTCICSDMYHVSLVI